MTRIDGVAALAALMRQQVQALRRPVAQQAATEGAATPPRGRKAKSSNEDVATVVARRVKALDSADKDAPRKAFRIFLEAVMLAEMGEELINDSGFQALVDDVLAQMRADGDLADAMERAARVLLRGGRIG